MIARLGFAFVAVSLVCVAAVHAEIYRWTDANGREQFSTHLADVPESQRAAALDAAGESGQSLSGFHSESKRTPAPAIDEAPIGASPLPAAAAPSEPRIGGRTETKWRSDAHEHIDAVARAEERLAACEAADEKKRMSSGLTGLDACAANESAIEHAEDALARFEDLARSKGVPPGWLR